MKKLITDCKLKKLTNQYDEEFYSDDIDELDEYTVIGIKHQIKAVKNKIREYKLRHLKLGKVRFDFKDEDSSFHIEGISQDIYWQIDRYLAIIIRDYLRFYAQNTQSTGSCVFEDEAEELNEQENENECGIDFNKAWKDKVNETANEFDDLVRLLEFHRINSKRSLDEQIEKAFKDLAYIYKDLSGM